MDANRVKMLVALLGIATVRATNPAKVSWGTHKMRMSSTGPDNTLPSFFFMAGGEEGGSLFKGFGYTGGDTWGGPHASPFEVPVLECEVYLFIVAIHYLLDRKCVPRSALPSPSTPPLGKGLFAISA